jgi:large-conductance mechanosensitive channel
MDSNIFIKKFYKDFQEYTFKNQVLIAASGFTIGIATSDFIKNIINDIFKPLGLLLFNYIVNSMHLTVKEYPVIYIIFFKLFNLFSLVIAWVFTIFFAFFIIEYILNRKIIGLSSIITDKEKGDFMQQKIESQNKNNIIPNNNDIIELHNEKLTIEKYKRFQ